MMPFKTRHEGSKSVKSRGGQHLPSPKSWEEAAAWYTESADQGRAMQDRPMKPMLKVPGTGLLKLIYFALMSSFTFKINLRRYTMATRRASFASARARCIITHYTLYASHMPRQSPRLISAFIELHGTV